MRRERRCICVIVADVVVTSDSWCYVRVAQCFVSSCLTSLPFHLSWVSSDDAATLHIVLFAVDVETNKSKAKYDNDYSPRTMGAEKYTTLPEISSKVHTSIIFIYPPRNLCQSLVSTYGQQLWRYTTPAAANLPICHSYVNRHGKRSWRCPHWWLFWSCWRWKQQDHKIIIINVFTQNDSSELNSPTNEYRSLILYSTTVRAKGYRAHCENLPRQYGKIMQWPWV